MIVGFVVRRLGPERVGLLATRRHSEPAGLDLASVLGPDVLVRGRLGPLSLRALQLAVRDRLGVDMPRSTLVRVHAAARGNPLFALEIARVLAETGAPRADEPLPVPDDTRELVRRRVDSLPTATRDLLLAAALLGQPAVEPLRRALGHALDADLEPAERAGIARVDGSVVAFTHPLHAAAVVATASAAERRRMHLRLAEAVDSREERARHLAFGTDEPDAAIAEVLDDGARAARARGGLHSAGELLERARALTPASASQSARERGLRAAEFHVHAGERDRARRLLGELLGEDLAPSQRGAALRLLAELCYCEEDLDASVRLLGEALRVDDDPHRAARTRLELAYVITTHRMDFAAAAELARQALESIRDAEDGPLVAEALAYSAMADYLAGRGVDWRIVERALALEDPDRIALMGMPVRAVAGCLLLYVGRHAEAREELNAVRRALTERGDERDLASVLLWLSWLETRCGDLAAAEQIAEETLTCAALGGNAPFQRWAIAQRAWIHAHTGALDEALRGASEAVAPDGRGIVQVTLSIAATRALAGLSAGDPQAAWDACEPLVAKLERAGPAEPVPAFFLPDALEALISLGRLERAAAILERFEHSARRYDRAWALATAARCRGLLLAARGDLTGALAALDDALVANERIEMWFERARTLLVKGATERRARRRASARASLAEAASEFERIGARVWAERARDELDRVAGPSRRDADDLTPSQRRTVELAVDGLSNKEIAARLVVSVHTVEVHLSRAYAKLGVRSRTQLAGRLRAGV
jgi:DNA-binding CsgD family transcriptional regulator